MKLCGPKLSLCGMIVSVWGILQLSVMGVLYKIQSVALLEDLPIAEETFSSIQDFYSAADKYYTMNAYNCWIATLLYLLTLLFSGHQFYMNSRSSV